MPDKKLTDKEIVKALECCVTNDCHHCPMSHHTTGTYNEYCGSDLMKLALDLINRLQEKDETRHKVFETKCEELEIAKAENERLQETIDDQDIEIARLYKEIDRWINAYEQVAWERDIFAEDMKEEIKKDCSYLMLDIKTIKAKAYKEFAERLKMRFSGTLSCSGGVIKIAVDNLLKELVGDNNET